jgi:hypothetical protein
MRTTIRDEPEGLTFLIPARRSRYMRVFLPIWLAGWAIGVLAGFLRLALNVVSGSPTPSTLVVWLVVWTVGGLVVALLWLWMLAGRERVVLTTERLRIRYELFGRGFSREFALADVRDLRVSYEPLSWWAASPRARLMWWGIGGGTVLFDHGARTVRFGAGVDEAEGELLVRRILERHPIPSADDVAG